jgi:predicted DNA-binding protein
VDYTSQMPNKRDPDQQIVTIWMSSKLKQSLQELAAQNAMKVSDFVRHLIEQAVLEQLQEIEKPRP